ncbi:hypothetical protein KY328_05945 [Candidatus Woesearchaeota archaeon]|nr:hypothetical protein [Candidatus Woesearchaeota archaeon]MBW3022442.1 hypothetical protein [Candidatus Woesearchaeota archaeon]
MAKNIKLDEINHQEYLALTGLLEDLSWRYYQNKVDGEVVATRRKDWEGEEIEGNHIVDYSMFNLKVGRVDFPRYFEVTLSMVGIATAERTPIMTDEQKQKDVNEVMNLLTSYVNPYES